MHLKVSRFLMKLWLEITGRVGTLEGRGAFKILTGKSTGNIPLGWPRRRWEDNIRIILKKYVPIQGINWTQDRDSGESPFEYGIDTLDYISHGVR